MTTNTHFLYIIIFGFFASCNASAKKKKTLTTEQQKLILVQDLNNKAISLSDGPYQYEEALMLLDSALKIKPDYSFARDNKFYFFAKKKDYDAMLKMTLGTFSQIICGEGILTRAVLFDLKNNQDSAKKYYAMGMLYYKKCLSENPQWEQIPAVLIQAAGYFKYSNHKDLSIQALEMLHKVNGFENYIVPPKEEFIQKALGVRDGSKYVQ